MPWLGLTVGSDLKQTVVGLRLNGDFNAAPNLGKHVP